MLLGAEFNWQHVVILVTGERSRPWYPGELRPRMVKLRDPVDGHAAAGPKIGLSSSARLTIPLLPGMLFIAWQPTEKASPVSISCRPR